MTPELPRPKLISIVTPCYNEEDNVEQLVSRISSVIASLPGYGFEHLLIDNASTDSTVAKIKALARTHPHVRLIVNTRNFGHIRSPIYGALQARGDAVMVMASDLQDPPELIPQFIKHWESGFKVVVGVKSGSNETLVMKAVRSLFYRTIGRISETRLIPQFTGFGLYDRQVIEIIRQIDDPYPYFRGMVAEIGFPHATIPYVQPARKRGITKNNFYTLYDIAMLGITTHSKVPIRIATISGFTLSGISLLVAIAYLIYKLIAWDNFALGTAPMIIGLFFFSSVQLFFIGLIGEYIGALHTQVLKRPLVVEQERVNFDDGPPTPL